MNICEKRLKFSTLFLVVLLMNSQVVLLRQKYRGTSFLISLEIQPRKMLTTYFLLFRASNQHLYRYISMYFPHSLSLCMTVFIKTKGENKKEGA